MTLTIKRRRNHGDAVRVFVKASKEVLSFRHMSTAAETRHHKYSEYEHAIKAIKTNSSNIIDRGVIFKFFLKVEV